MSKTHHPGLRALSVAELALVSGGKAEAEAPPVQGGGLPKPILSGKPPAAPLPIFTDLP